MKNAIAISILLTLFFSSSCISTLNSNKSNSTDLYSEDLSAYLPKDVVDTVVISESNENELVSFDSTLIITDRLDSALQIVNNYTASKTKYIEGLSIQLYSGNDRASAKEVQMKAYRYFPDSKPRIIFDQPNYKVRMEKFYSQLEAYPVFKKIQSRFSRAILVPTRIPVSGK